MIPDSTPEDIHRAIEQFDSKYRAQREWSDWTQNRNHKFAISYGNELYPVKFVVSLATRMPVSKFSGGDSSGQATSHVRNLGFEVIQLRTRNPKWTRDELILALDLYLRYRERPPGKNSDEVRSLSDELNRLGRSLGIGGAEDFRNINGVYMKLMNFRRFDPHYTEQGKTGLLRGGKEEESVWREYSSSPTECHRVADAIRNGISHLEAHPASEEYESDEGAEAQEGRLLTVLHRRRERSRKIVNQKKNSVLKKRGVLQCEACGFNFKTTYGSRGDGYIECHHTKPVSEAERRTRLADLVLLCANCHRMVHAKRPWLSVEELRELLDG